MLKFLASLALIPHALRGLGALAVIVLVGIAVVSALLLLLIR
jgi:hypothetical protein